MDCRTLRGPWIRCQCQSVSRCTHTHFMLVHWVVRILTSSTGSMRSSCVDLVRVILGAVEEVTSQLRAILSRRRHVAALKKTMVSLHLAFDIATGISRPVTIKKVLGDHCRKTHVRLTTTAGAERSALENVLNALETCCHWEPALALQIDIATSENLNVVLT